MNILVIGNGFDIAHKLKTEYKDFLFYIEHLDFFQGGLPCNEDARKAYFACKKNKWYLHFKQQLDNAKDRSWIDFEKEIGDMVLNMSSDETEHLDSFTDCFNYYIFDHINNMPVNKRLPDIYENNFDYVLSFNYSNTYERIYGNVFDPAKTVNYSYVHGKAEKNAKLVLGCDNLLTAGFEESPEYSFRVPF